MHENRLIAVAVEAARKAADLLMAEFGRPVLFEEKSRRNYVTPLDGEAETLILDTLRAAFPDHTLLSEEAGEIRGGGEYRWIIDPLSSTRNYLHGMPHWGVCLAVERREATVASLVMDPFADELYTAASGKGAWRNGGRISVSPTPSLSRAMLCATFSVEGESAEERIAQGLGYIGRLSRLADLRSLGSAGLHLAYVASGRLDGFVSNSEDFFATVAGALLVREAGGVVTNFAGEEWTPGEGGLAASNGRFHEEFLRVVRGD